MTDLFPFADAAVVGSEGSHANDPLDPGGETFWGVAHAAHPKAPWPPTWAQAQAMRRTYWDAHRCGEMTWRWALAVYDGAINQGTATVRLAQLALHAVEDGLVGNETIALMAKASDDAYRAFLALRVERYVTTPQFSVYGMGWIKRVLMVAQAAEHAPE
jgi:lysozyme family protein